MLLWDDGHTTPVVFAITVVNGYGLQRKFLDCTGKKKPSVHIDTHTQTHTLSH